jgi:hypothetical protein
MSETHHHRKEHLRTHPVTGEKIPVQDAIVKNTGPRTGRAFTEVADQRDGLMGLIDPDSDVLEAEASAVEGITDAERAASASLLNRLMGQDVVNEKGQPLDEEAARLLTIKNLIETLGIEMQDDGEVDDIVFALESSDWSSQGFTRKEHLPWAALGLGPEEAAQWRDNDFTPFTVGPWKANRYYSRVAPEDATHYHKAGIPVDEARQWSMRDVSGENAVGWIKAGVNVYEATRWSAAGVPNVHERNDWVALGVDDPADVAILKSLGDAAANRWIEADVELAKATAWNDMVKPGYTEKDLAPFARGEVRLKSDLVRKWQEENIPADQIDEFLKKGYTPKRAASRIKKGQTASAAEDLRGKEPVPGKAWKELKGAVIEAKNSNSLDAKYEESRHADGAVTITVSLHNQGAPEGSYPRRNYQFKFTNTGRFLSASGTGIWRGSVRKVSDMANLIKDY